MPKRVASDLRRALAIGGFACVHAVSAQAQPAVSAVPPPDRVAVASPANEQPGFLTGITRRTTLLGDAGGLRPLPGRIGITVQATDVEEWLGNAAGGLRRGTTYDALTTLTLQLDTRKAFGWAGGTLNLSALQIRGRSLSQHYLDNLQTVSGISAEPTTRLWEAWYQQAFLDGAFDVRLGQQSIDQEFMVSAGAALYLNTMMGWPMLPSADLYAGGPAYPLSSPGVRLRGSTGPFTMLGGVFQDNPPSGPFSDDSQLRGATRWGGNFNLRTGALFIAELQYTRDTPAAGDMQRGAGGLPGTYKLGVWFDTAAFPDQRFDSTGLSLANPASNGVPRMDRTNFSLYGLADQTIWRPDPAGPRALAVFVRAMGAPGDRNLIDFSANAGLDLTAPLPGRDNDTFGIGFGVAKVSPAAAALDADAAPSPGRVPLSRSTETFVEVTYQAQVMPWWQIQPDFQFIHRPGGGIPDPNNRSQRLRDEAVFGVRSTITF